jgi:hypothetical protein
MQETTGATGGQVIPVVRARLAEAPVRGAVALRGPWLRLPGGSERGMVSAEWAVGIIAAVAVAGVLLSVVTSGPVEAAILKFILQVIRAFSGGLSRL